MRNTRWLIALATTLLLATGLTSAATLSGSFTNNSTNDTVDLTAQGAVDWAIWGFGTGIETGSFDADDQKSGGAGIDKTLFALVNSPDPLLPTDGGGWNIGPSFTWSDGTNTASQGGIDAVLLARGDRSYTFYPAGEGLGLQVSAPDTQIYELKVYVANNNQANQMTASLSGASPYTDTSFASGGDVSGVYTFQFQADTAGDVLTVEVIPKP
jgi:hypothetical protein